MPIRPKSMREVEDRTEFSCLVLDAKKESAELNPKGARRMIATSREEARCGNGVNDTKAEWIPRWRRSPTPCKRVA